MPPVVVFLIGAFALLVMAEAAYYYVKTYNGLVDSRNNILRAWSNIDVLLKQRMDEIPNLVSTVKGYVAHEHGIFVEVAKARTTLEQARTVGEKEASDNIIRETLGRLYAVVEDYPVLKADQSFLKLQVRITQIENQIADRREFYNSAATIYNTRIQSIPDNIVANHSGFGRIPLFKASDEERRRIEVFFRGNG
ncbi:MAG: LemA family protein [Candidatus Altiarchaeota archaeon]